MVKKTEDELAAEALGLAAEPAEERLHPILTNEEFLAAKEEARKKVEAQKLAAAKKAVIEAEMQALAREEGALTGESAKDEMVSVFIDLPEFCSDVRLNGVPYWHGHTYTVPRHVADSIREIVQNTWRHQDREIDGKDLTQHYQRARNTMVGPSGVVNAPAKAA